jgi:hypothetical protein
MERLHKSFCQPWGELLVPASGCDTKFNLNIACRLEHKVFAGPFASYFPRAQVWAMDGQFSFPVRLPLSFLGFGARKVEKIPDKSVDAPWAGGVYPCLLHTEKIISHSGCCLSHLRRF